MQRPAQPWLQRDSYQLFSVSPIGFPASMASRIKPTKSTNLRSSSIPAPAPLIPCYKRSSNRRIVGVTVGAMCRRTRPRTFPLGACEAGFEPAGDTPAKSERCEPGVCGSHHQSSRSLHSEPSGNRQPDRPVPGCHRDRLRLRVPGAQPPGATRSAVQGLHAAAA